MFSEELRYKTQSVVGWNLKPDILIHGSPCQDFSIAGHQGKAKAEGGQQAEPQTDEQVAEAIQQEQAKPLVIEIPEPATKGTITIYTPDGAVYGYYGEITINSDGSTGQDIDIVCAGYLEGFLEHGEPEYTEESEDGRNE